MVNEESDNILNVLALLTAVNITNTVINIMLPWMSQNLILDLFLDEQQPGASGNCTLLVPYHTFVFQRLKVLLDCTSLMKVPTDERS